LLVGVSFSNDYDEEDINVGEPALYVSSFTDVWYAFLYLVPCTCFSCIAMAAGIKFAFLMGKAPADFAAMASKLYPIVVSTPLVHPFGLTANQFIFLLAAFEMLAAVGLFFHHKISAIMITAVMLGAEYVFFTQAGNPAMPPSPACGDKTNCVGQYVLHAVIIGMAIMTYASSKSICSAWMQASKGWFSARRARTADEVQTPTRPRRAAAMKAKKDL